MRYKNVYFIGIGGIGMSAIARYFQFKGSHVSGYDRTPSDLTHALEAEGIEVHYEDRPECIPSDVRNTLVIYTPAVPDSFDELVQARERGYRVIKRSQVLGEITAGQRCLAVAGTHGKTTTCTLVAHILTESGTGCSAFLGGISKNYGTNMLVSHTPTVVAEADEFDRSFHQLHPAIASISAMDADHLDIYGDLVHMQEAYRIFASQVSETLILKLGLPIRQQDVSARIFTYHFDDERADFRSTNLRLDATGHYTYDLVYPGGKLNDIRVGALGWVNVENSIAAAAICLCYGLDAQKVRHAIGTFEGAQRRLDVHLNTPSLTYIDDYAHHPTEIRATLTAAMHYPHRKLWCLFQPHTYTRTAALLDEFADALSLADEVVLADIYAAREKNTIGISSEDLKNKMAAAGCQVSYMTNFGQIAYYIRESAREGDVVITMGAGNIYAVGDDLLSGK